MSPALSTSMIVAPCIVIGVPFPGSVAVRRAVGGVPDPLEERPVVAPADRGDLLSPVGHDRPRLELDVAQVFGRRIRGVGEPRPRREQIAESASGAHVERDFQGASEVVPVTPCAHGRQPATRP